MRWDHSTLASQGRDCISPGIRGKFAGVNENRHCKMPAREIERGVLEVGRVRGDHWERFDRLQRNLRPFLRGKPKRARIERFRSYGDLEHGRSDAPSRT